MTKEAQQNQGSTDNTGAGGGEATATWLDSISDESLKGNEILKGYDSAESLAKAHLTAHEENVALKQQIEASKPVLPDKAEAYELPTQFEGMPDELAGEYSKQVSSIALAAGLTKEQAGKAFEALVSSELQSLKDEAAKIERETAETKKALQKELGDKYEEKLSNAFLRCTEIAGKMGISAEAFKTLTDGTGLGDNATFIKFAIGLSELISPDHFERNQGRAPGGKSDADVLFGKT